MRPLICQTAKGPLNSNSATARRTSFSAIVNISLLLPQHLTELLGSALPLSAIFRPRTPRRSWEAPRLPRLSTVWRGSLNSLSAIHSIGPVNQEERETVPCVSSSVLERRVATSNSNSSGFKGLNFPFLAARLPFWRAASRSLLALKQIFTFEGLQFEGGWVRYTRPRDKLVSQRLQALSPYSCGHHFEFPH